MATATNTPGWYPDPDGGQGQRWWNGVGWSDARRGAGTTPAVPPQVAGPPAVVGQEPAGLTPPGQVPATQAPVIYSASNPAPQYPGQIPAPGAPGYTARAAVTLDARQNPMAVYSFVAGIIAFFFNVLLVPSILAVVFGSRALTRSNQLRAAGQEDKTRGLAVAGLALGVVGGVWGLIQGIFFIVGFLPLFFIDAS